MKESFRKEKERIKNTTENLHEKIGQKHTERVLRAEQRDAEQAAHPMKKSRASIILGIISAVFLLLTGLGIWFMREFLSDTEAVREMIGNHYVIGALCLIVICILQVVIALVPGELVEIASGYVFGAWGGAILCLIGAMLGSVLTIMIVRRFGRKFVYAFYPKEKIESLPILNNPVKRNRLIFLLFLIPGTPKDLLTYAIGLTDIKISQYILLTLFARIPSIIISTMGGDAVGSREFVKALVVFLISAAISVVGLFFYNFVSKKHAAHKAEEKKAHESEPDEPSKPSADPAKPSDPSDTDSDQNG